MKYIRILLIAAIGITFLSCERSGGLTSPDNHSLSLNKDFDSASVHLNNGETVEINKSITIKFDGVASDSRCPEDAICVWAGNGEVNLTLTSGGKSEKKIINTTLEPRSISYGDYLIEIKALYPYPRTDRKINPEDYNIDLTIKPNDTAKLIKSVILIDGGSRSEIKTDMLNINEAIVSGDYLSFNAGYSGGCAKHAIELFAFKEIEKTNPAQVTLSISHDANNDMCEAYITQTINFDLTELKNFLKSSYDIQDKVLLIIHDTSGRPIRDAAIEYSF
ncbi:MAG: hypothetical protein HYS25_07805 [Ignavibacteriales bacterium]|nr:hypothetical protein [Ignavibacteriales bacterium]